jgi:hypothetical protein
VVTRIASLPMAASGASVVVIALLAPAPNHARLRGSRKQGDANPTTYCSPKYQSGHKTSNATFHLVVPFCSLKAFFVNGLIVFEGCLGLAKA